MRTEDGHIIHECLNGDPAEFGLLVDKYKESIYALAYSKLRNFHDAQDVTQETFIKAYSKLHTLRHWDNLAMWLGAIASNLCKQLIRSRSRRPDSEFIEDYPPEIISNISVESYNDSMVQQSLNEALDSLPETYRQVLTLHYFSGMKSMEIARMLGVSLRTVTERLRTGRECLREEMVVMMSRTFKEQKLPAGFTFRIVETIKRMKIHPVTQSKGIPWGLSLATGVIVAILSLNPHIPQLDQFGTISGSPLQSESKVLKVGEIPVDILKTSSIAILSSKMGKGNAGEPKQPDMQNAFFMAPQGEGEWTKKADMPTARYGLCTAIVNGKIYAIGGRPNANAVLSNVEEYDPVKDKWTAKKDMPKGLYYCDSCALDSKIYVMGGFTWANNEGDTDVLYEYDPSNDLWTEKANMPSKKHAMKALPVNGKIYVIGGAFWDMVAVPTPFATVQEYDPKADTWKRKSDMPTARAAFAACVVGTKIYAMGGSRTLMDVGMPGVEIYDTLTDTWTKGVDMPGPRWLSYGSVVDGKIYSIGKNGNNDSSVVEEFDPGFISVDPGEKLPKTWGTLKAK